MNQIVNNPDDACSMGTEKVSTFMEQEIPQNIHSEMKESVHLLK